MGELFQPTHLLVLLVILVVLFGGKKLPELGRGLGQSLNEFKKVGRELSGAKDEVKGTVHSLNREVRK